MPKTPEQFDGNLAWVQMDDVDPYKGLYIHTDTIGRFIPVKPDFLIKQEHIKMFRELNSYNLPEVEGGLEKARNELIRSHGREVLEIMESGRMQLTLLLNTPGGIFRSFDQIVRSIKSRKGRVSAFGSKVVMSAGAELLFLAPKSRRFVKKYSTLLFHLNSLAATTEHTLREEYRRMKKELYEKKMELAKKIISFLNGDNNALGEYYDEIVDFVLENKKHFETLKNEESEYDIEKIADCIDEYLINERYCCSEDEFVDEYLTEMKFDISYKKEVGEENIREVLLQNTVPEKRKEMKRVLEQAFSNTDESDCPITFNADQVRHFGLAKIYTGPYSRLFEQLNNVSAEAYKDTAIEEFFERDGGVNLLMKVLDSASIDLDDIKFGK